MKRLLQLLQKNAHGALSIPALLCFITFITNFVQALQDGNIDAQEYHTLLTYTDGFETVFLLLVMLALRDKKH
jgi:hypothetical protein